MSYKALYRKYRPIEFSDVVGQEHITSTLKSQLSSGKIFHAYLFTGTRGTGKTTCAKILAKAVNCLSPKNGDPCGECEACRAIQNDDVMDIVEIDAASNNSVDNIRELREQVNFTPAAAKYRVYIIDEVHMLTLQAFNALLKTLEEPPTHVIFILATTEVHKLPTTILSRCQRFDFKRIEPQIICERLKYVAQKEGFFITDDAANMIASIADGGMRDALSTLDLCVSSDRKVTEDVVAKVCGLAGNDYLLKFADCIRNLDTEGALVLTDKLYSASVDMLKLLNDLVLHYRNLMIVKTVKDKHKPIVCSASHLEKLIAQADEYNLEDIVLTLRYLQDSAIKMQNGNRRSEMELMLVRLCSPNLRHDIDSLERRIAALEKMPRVATVTAPKVANETVAEETVDTVTEEVVDITNTDTESGVKTTDDEGLVDSEVWITILEELSKSAPLLRGILNTSRAFIKGDFCLVDCTNPQFAELMNSSNGQYKESLRRAIETVTGISYKLGPYKKRKSVVISDDPLDEIRNRLKELEVPNKQN